MISVAAVIGFRGSSGSSRIKLGDELQFTWDQMFFFFYGSFPQKKEEEEEEKNA